MTVCVTLCISSVAKSARIRLKGGGGVGGAVPCVSVSAGVSLDVFTLRLESAGSRYLTSPKSNAMGAINFP